MIATVVSARVIKVVIIPQIGDRQEVRVNIV